MPYILNISGFLTKRSRYSGRLHILSMNETNSRTRANRSRWCAPLPYIDLPFFLRKRARLRPSTSQ
jgi:hypothetical protein